jgi:putative ABC transport system ATP-binding protein
MIQNIFSQSLLTVDNVSYFYQDGEEQRYILKNISCSFEKGVFYTILGESGSGKTTLLSLLSALDKPSTGQVIYEGQPLDRLGYDNYRRNKVGIVFQQYNLINYMTALENVQVAMSITDNPLPADKSIVALNLLDYIGIDQDKASRTTNKLSGGEQQRVAIARALATNVDILLADEPTGNINEEMAGGIVDIFKNQAHQHNKCVIVVTHSHHVASQSDVVFRLSKGELKRDE